MTTATLSTPADLARILNVEVQPRTILDWRRQYGWPCTKVGGFVRFSEEDVEQILAMQKVRPVVKRETPRPAGIPGQTRRSAARSA